jgi:glycosyltransferase involved in cell wall biosynthesis
VDNVSTDKTLEIARRYTHTIISEKDRGEPDALNKGLKLATGDVIAYLDSDDIYEPYAFWVAEQKFGHNDWIYGKAYFIDKDGKQIRRTITTLKQLLQRNYSYDKLCNLCFICQPSVFLKREFVQRVGEFNVDYPLIFDYEYWLRAGQLSSPSYVPLYLSSMRAHGGSNSVKFSTRQMRESLDLVYRFKKKHHYLSYAMRMGILSSCLVYYKTIGRFI